jgi:hypothetical protein
LKKSAHVIVEEAYNELVELEPTEKEITVYADKMENVYGVVAYSKSRSGSGYFLDLHDTWKKKFGGRVHVDVGFVNEEYRDERDVPDTTHLMLDKDYAPDFIEFIKKMREKGAL